jgi:hypothetical protein
MVRAQRIGHEIAEGGGPDAAVAAIADILGRRLGAARRSIVREVRGLATAPRSGAARDRRQRVSPRARRVSGVQ